MKISKRYLTALLLFLLLCGCSNRPQGSGSTQPTQSNNQLAQETPGPAAPRNDRPLLFALIKNMSIYPVPGQTGNVAVSLVVSVSNSGVVSTATDWKLEVTSNKRTFSVDPVHVNGVVEMPGTAKTADLGKEDLALKSTDTAIVPGTPLEGILTFVLPNTSEGELTQAKATVVLLFKDKVGNAYHTTRLFVGQKKQ